MFSSPSHHLPPRERRLTIGECQDWLHSHREGRLGYQTGRGPRSVVVCYALSGGQIMFQLPDYNDIVHYAPGEEVELEVEGTKPATGDYDTVCVKGKAALVSRRSSPEPSEAAFAETWPEGISTSVICLPLTHVEGVEHPLNPVVVS